MDSSIKDKKAKFSADKVLKIKLLASGTQSTLTLKKEEEDLSLMEWLQKKGLSIASSCSGKGICTACSVSEGKLSCQITVKNWPASETIDIDYL